MRKDIFESATTRLPETDTINEAGGTAYSMTSKHALAQYATTGTFGDTFYASGINQLNEMKELVKEVDSTYIAKLAFYSREYGYMKDMPAFLSAVLTTRGEEGLILLKKIFPLVIDNGRMLRNFVQIIRSGVLGRKSLGSAPRNMVKGWLHNRHPKQLFRDSVGNSPSIADIIKMVHPTPQTKEEEAFFGYLIGKGYAFEYLPSIVQHYERFKSGDTDEIPNVEFRLLTGLDLSDKIWKEIAKNAKWMMTRMNLNTFARHNVFTDKNMVDMIATRLSNPEEVYRSRNFPFELLTAYKATESNEDIPNKIKSALQEAVNLSLSNVPSFEDKKIIVCPDTSGSMLVKVLGYGKKDQLTRTDTSPMCIDVAGLISSALLRNNPESIVIPFASFAHSISLNPRDTLTTNSEKIWSLGGGGTDCSAPLRVLNEQRERNIDLVIFISDYESWIDNRGKNGCYSNATGMMTEWKKLKRNNPNAKLVCIDCAPNKTIQAPDRNEILNIGGFSDIVFKIMEMFVNNELDSGKWVKQIESIEL